MAVFSWIKGSYNPHPPPPPLHPPHYRSPLDRERSLIHPIPRQAPTGLLKRVNSTRSLFAVRSLCLSAEQGTEARPTQVSVAEVKATSPPDPGLERLPQAAV
jgi:hypothetical protein